MTLARILKTIFLIEFVKGLIMAVKEMFRKSKTIGIYRFRKNKKPGSFWYRKIEGDLEEVKNNFFKK